MSPPSVLAKDESAAHALRTLSEEASPTFVAGMRLDQIAARNSADAAAAPDDIVRLRETQVGTYFRLITLRDEAERARAAEMLRVDLVRIAEYFQRDRLEPEFENQTRTALEDFARGLTYRRLEKANRADDRRLGELTLEEVVAQKQFELISRGPSVLTHAYDLVARRLRGATPNATRMVAQKTVGWLGRQMTPRRDPRWRKAAPLVAAGVGAAAVTWGVQRALHTNFLSGFLLGSAWGAVQAGPLATLVSAGTSWFLTPTTEYLKVWNNRYTGNAEAAITLYFSRLKGAMSGEDSFDRVKVATLAEDLSNFAGATPAQQEWAIEKFKKIAVAVKNTFGRLFTDTIHHGRSLITMLWGDELATVHMVDDTEWKVRNLRSQDEMLLVPYRTDFVVHHRRRQNQTLTQAYARVVDRFERFDWVSASARERANLLDEGQRFIDQLRALRIPRDVAWSILENQRTRCELIGKIVAALTIIETRYLFYPEANRNMVDEARQIQRTIRGNLRIQAAVERYLPQIQTVQRAMGLRESSCETVLSPEDEAIQQGAVPAA